ncbi:MAG: hypothetical protein ACK4YQ_05200 [Phenylobacterium sp.]|uniref:O-linked N-acetylglucosamine transferase, SPINDLY family protein n=1 Tax=Phenylobacterium sp. TaxID=1871053 RepID=UPI00391A9CBC
MDSATLTKNLLDARRLVLGGDAAAAVLLLQRMAAGAPAEAECRYWLASASLALGDADAATAHLNDARILQAIPLIRGMRADLARCRAEPDFAARIAQALYGQGFVALSSVVWTMALQAEKPAAQTLLSFALSLQHQGRIDEAVQVFRAADEMFDSASVAQFLLFPLLFCEDGGEGYAREAMAWARRFAPGEQGRNVQQFPPRRGKLRIGYVAPRFAGSQLNQFIAPLLNNHDPDAVAVTLYPESAEEIGNWPEWIDVHPIGGLSAHAAAERVRQDGIDVLADCWGHTAGSRLDVFALKPAPVQVAWLNFVQTTGLPQMDYVLHASSAIGLSDPALFTEEVCDIGPVFTAFEPSPNRLAPVDTPALANGYVTFGSFNHPAKLGASVVETWSKVLQGAPGSRLLLKYRYFVDPVLQRTTQARFAAHGVAPERIVFEGHSSGDAYHRAFGAVDLALDTWPAPGSTTSLEALSNGLPVLALSEGCLTGAYAASFARASGLPELAAPDATAFVEKAIELTRDPIVLNALRSRVRPAFEHGPVCDGVGFTRRIERRFAELVEQRRSSSVAAGAA